MEASTTDVTRNATARVVSSRGSLNSTKLPAVISGRLRSRKTLAEAGQSCSVESFQMRDCSSALIEFQARVNAVVHAARSMGGVRAGTAGAVGAGSLTSGCAL